MEPRPCFVLEWKGEQVRQWRLYWSLMCRTPLKKTERCKLGSSLGEPPNWVCCTMELSASLSSKLFATIRGAVILGVWLWTPWVTKSLKALFYVSLPSAIASVNVLSSNAICLFNLWKVLRILGSNSNLTPKWGWFCINWQATYKQAKNTQGLKITQAKKNF